jgi:hypothetical protein
MTCHEDLLLSVNEQLSTASGQKSEFQELYGEDIESVKTPHD